MLAVSSRSERLLKGWTVATTSTTLASASHGLAGGHLPHPMVWALCTALSAMACVYLSGRRLPQLGLFVSVALSQGLLHWLFSVQGLASAKVPVQATHQHGLGGVASHELHAHVAAGSPAAMLVLHLLAAVTTYLVLIRGRALAHRAIGYLKLVFRAIFSLPSRVQIPTPVRAVVPQRRPAVNFLQTWLNSVRVLRGPPAVLIISQ